MECLKDCRFKGQVEECKNGCLNKAADRYWEGFFIDNGYEVAMRVVIEEKICPWRE